MSGKGKRWLRAVTARQVNPSASLRVARKDVGIAMGLVGAGCLRRTSNPGEQLRVRLTGRGSLWLRGLAKPAAGLQLPPAGEK